MAVVLGLVLGPAVASGLTISAVSQSGAQIGHYEPLTVRFALSRSYSNPFDPKQVDARFEFTGPSGQRRVIPAFYYGGSPAWMARIVPLEIGAHTCRILVDDYTGESAEHTLAFTAVFSNTRGFVRVDPLNPRYLRFDNGEPYMPVGQNLCWYGRDPLFYAWLDRMAAAKQNWTRYWMVPYIWQGLEWGPNTDDIPYGVGRYSQYQSQMFDNMLAGARDRGILVQLCMGSFNGWNFNVYANWNENPYNTANGGMCAHPMDYFIHPEAKELARQYYRYIVARWAYNTGILCWEFFNEIDALGSGSSRTFWGNEQLVADWHREMAQYIRSIDPFRHPITTSFADGGPRASYALFWQMPEMEIVQVHRYSIGVPDSFIDLIRSVRSFNKPVIMGEGTLAGDTSQLDPQGNTLHLNSWAAAVEGSGIMPWWWDSWIHPRDLYGRFTPVANYLAGEDWATQGLGPLSATQVAGPNVSLYGSSGEHHAYLFIRATAAPVSGVRIRLNSILPGMYDLEYWNTLTGQVFNSSRLTTGAAPILDIPTFNWDVAVKFKEVAPGFHLEPVVIHQQAVVGTSIEPDSFTITPEEPGTLGYAIDADVAWLSVSPDSGTLSGEPETISVAYNLLGLNRGDYTGRITVANAENPAAAQTVLVLLTVLPRPGDMDNDGDVDQEDFGVFQVCMLGAGVPQLDPVCIPGRFDADNDVDQIDLSHFRACMSGPNVPSDPTCAD